MNVLVSTETAIGRINDERQPHLDMDLLEEVFDEFVRRGKNVLRLLMERECTLEGEWDYLCGFRRQGTRPPPENDAVLESLRRRLLVVDEGDRWRLHVPMMKRWLRGA
jgi:hypothetical protein